LRDLNEKLFANLFVDFVPPALVTSDIIQLRAFIDSVQKAVIKPLNVMGGESVFLMDHHDKNCNVILETITQRGQQLVLIQKYLDAIDQGDKRILLIDGEPVPCALVRMTKENDFRCNIASGATFQTQTLSPRDKEICKIVGPVLKKEGLLFVGIDIIGDYLIEINITSPGCLANIEKFSSLDLSGQLFDAIEKNLVLSKKSQV
jgi:glutathione synthase